MTANAPDLLRVSGADVRVGDDLWFLGEPHRITAIAIVDDPRPSCVFPPTALARIARDASGWAMTLLPLQSFHVSPRTAA